MNDAQLGVKALSPNVSPISEPSTQNIGWKTYTHPYGISFQYPKDWEVAIAGGDGDLGTTTPTAKQIAEFMLILKPPRPNDECYAGLRIYELSRSAVNSVDIDYSISGEKTAFRIHWLEQIERNGMQGYIMMAEATKNARPSQRETGKNLFGQLFTTQNAGKTKITITGSLCRGFSDDDWTKIRENGADRFVHERGEILLRVMRSIRKLRV
jgi:hypothetical protein